MYGIASTLEFRLGRLVAYLCSCAIVLRVCGRPENVAFWSDQGLVARSDLPTSTQSPLVTACGLPARFFTLGLRRKASHARMAKSTKPIHI